ncbi:hypothetical protein [Xenorhabdus entomophaga]|uniref:hypothetical protein n=1 Tax=Xenorhabdus entomophaga TaxID=3136257 RepID=UPI0030F49075
MPQQCERLLTIAGLGRMFDALDAGIPGSLMVGYLVAVAAVIGLGKETRQMDLMP